LRQLGNRQFHRAADWNSSNAFVLIDPRVRRQFRPGFLAQLLQILHALFRARLFVIASARHRPNDSEHNYAKQHKQKHDAQPRGKWRWGMCNPAERFGVGHFS
jgi:hypothetical protein